MKTSFTPGPWKAVWGTHSVHGYKDWQVLDNNETELLIEIPNGEDAEANARLIAAAPDMINEMLRYLPVLEWVESMPEIWDRATKGTGIATLNGYKNAILKATGEKEEQL